MLHQIERALKRALFVIEAHGGRLVHQGNGTVQVLFKGPEPAIVASCEMRARVDQLPPIAGARLAMRVGLQCGEAEISGQQLVGEASAIAAGLLTQASAGQILAGHRVFTALPPLLQHVLRPVVLHPDGADARESQVMEVDCAGVVGGRIVPSATKVHEIVLKLADGDRDYLVKVESEGLTLGRDPECSVLIHDPRASRRHAWIGYRNHGFLLEDSSSNGTFVTFEDGSEHMVRHATLPLAGKGNIAFGEDFHESPQQVFRFEVLP